jgi:hypothetical protein
VVVSLNGRRKDGRKTGHREGPFGSGDDLGKMRIGTKYEVQGKYNDKDKKYEMEEHDRYSEKNSSSRSRFVHRSNDSEGGLGIYATAVRLSFVWSVTKYYLWRITSDAAND